MNVYFSCTCAYIPSYQPSLLVGLLDYIQCPHRAVVGKFLLAGQHWHIHVKGSIGNRPLCVFLASPAVSRMSCLSDLDEFRDGRQVAVLLSFRGVLPPRSV